MRAMKVQFLSTISQTVIPAKAGIHGVEMESWIPAFAGMTVFYD